MAHGTAGALAAERKHDIPVRGPGDRSSLALKMWNRSVDATGTVVESYLRARGITIAIPSSLRLLRDALHPSGRRFPAMLAAVRNAMGEIVAVHRTFLSADGTSKAAVPDAKMMLGPCGGRAVHLAAAGRTIAIAEGIETALSVAEATGLPTWAALSAHGVATLLLPELPIGRDIVIFADNDPAGLSAANRARARFLLEERRVRVVVPEHPGSDFNDVLRGAA